MRSILQQELLALAPALSAVVCLCAQLHRIVVSQQSPDALLGLPGVLCVIGSSREKGHEKADIPVHVFAPEGTCEFLSTMYDVSMVFGAAVCRQRL
jgi:ribonuclease BN (tRNA processing enzyme)